MQEPAFVVRSLTYRIDSTPGPKLLLDDISFRLPQKHFTAIIGASGCGKTTLLRALAGHFTPTNGSIVLLGHRLLDYKRRYPLALGYLPQVSQVHEELTVTEILEFGARLQLPVSVNAAVRRQWIGYLIKLAGLESVQNQSYKTLSGGQRRRVALAEVLISDPPLLIVDELTSGLDPQAEASMMQWLRFLAHEGGKTIVLVTHAVRNLDQTDSMMFMKDGRILFHGSYQELHDVTGIHEIEELYVKNEAEIPRTMAPQEVPDVPMPQPIRTGGPPSAWRQLQTLVRRQWLLLSRDRMQILLHAVVLLTFPALVAVFAMGGLPQVRNLSLNLNGNIVHSLQEQLLYLKDSLSSASLVSGLIMFQVILLTLAGANNGSREIAKERPIWEKERRTGLSSVAYFLSKLQMVAAFTVLQSFWMTWFVKGICRFPGDFGTQFIVLLLTNLAMGATCLAISARASSTEKASLLAIYLVGLQLPLSGAVLALPEWLAWITRPVIAAYWGWSGYLKSLADFSLYDIVRQTTHTWLATPGLACAILAAHILLASALTIFFLRPKS
jgi:ABC transport system ATP-binding/permease protein